MSSKMIAELIAEIAQEVIVEEEVEKRLKKVKRITKKLKQDALEKYFYDKGKRLTNLRKVKETTLDERIEEHNVDIKYYQRFFIQKKVEQEIEDKKREIERAKEQEEWKIERERKEDYLEKYDIPFDTMGHKYVVIQHLIRFIKDKDPEFVKYNQYLKRQKEIAEEEFISKRTDYYGNFRGGTFEVINGYEEEISEKVIETWTRISKNNSGEKKQIFYKCKLGYYLDYPTLPHPAVQPIKEFWERYFEEAINYHYKDCVNTPEGIKEKRFKDGLQTNIFSKSECIMLAEYDLRRKRRLHNNIKELD